jgi:hypothetical protein
MVNIGFVERQRAQSSQIAFRQARQSYFEAVLVRIAPPDA